MTSYPSRRIVAGASAIAFALAWLLGAGSRVTIPAHPGIPEDREDPRARARFEWLRLHDPRTGDIPAGIAEKERAFARTLPTREGLATGPWTAKSSAIPWTQRGPVNVGGRTRAFAVDISNPGILLAGGVSGGMWKSINGGQSWRKVTTPTQLHSVTCIAQDPRPGKTEIWYYGTGELTGNSAAGGGGSLYRGDGIFKSTDGGNSWFRLPSTVSGTPQVFSSMFQYVWNLAVNASSSADEVFAATVGGIVRSTNGGESWTVALGGAGVEHPRFTDLAVTTGGVIYATMSEMRRDLGSTAVDRGLWRSTDGSNWIDIRPVSPPWPGSFKRVVIGIAPSDERIVYFLGETPGYGKPGSTGDETEYTSLWKYTYIAGDGSGSGGQWEDRSTNIPAYGLPVGDFVSQGSYNLVIKVAPQDSRMVFIGSTNLFRSSNGFRTPDSTAWIGGYSDANDVNQYQGHHCDQHALVFSPVAPLRLYSGNDGGVFVTENFTADKVEWNSLNSGYYTTQFYTLALDQATGGNPVLIGGMQDNGTWFTYSQTTGVPWVRLLSGDGAFCAIADNRSSYYVSAQNGITYRLLLSFGGALLNYSRVDPAGGTDYLFINPFVLDRSNNSVMYLAAGGTLWRNTNLLGIPLRTVSSSADNPTSVNWTRMTGASVQGDWLTALGVSWENPASQLYIGTAWGQIYRLDNARTAPPATIPLDVSSNRGFPLWAYINCIAVDPTDGDRVLAVFSNYGVPSIFFTTNGGASWSDVSGNLEEMADGTGSGPSVRWATIQTFGGGPQYFVGTSTGLYATRTLQGQSTVWVQEGSETIGNVVVDMIQSRSQDGLVAVGTHGQGVFTGTAQPVGPIPPEVPMVTRLEQNFPNPFNPFTTIRFALAEPAFVTLKVFSVDGSEVAGLVSEERPAGVQPDVMWYPQRQASGVYFVRLKAGAYSETRKMVLAR